jgi:hypothetical protein
VVQQGISYVPQTGQALQTQGLVVPDPDNAGSPYVNALAPWVIEGAAAVVQQLTDAEQALRSTQSLETSSSGEWGSGVEEDWSGASISAVPKCKAWWKLGSPGGEKIYLTGNFQCQHRVANVKMQLCLFWSEKGAITGHLCASEGGAQFGDIKEHEQAVFGKCDKDRMYTGFMWVHEWADARHKAKGLWVFSETDGLESPNRGWVKCEGGEGEEIAEEIITQLVDTVFG